MSSTNINDPVGVAALLEQLKASAAWQELSTAALASESLPPAQVDAPPSTAQQQISTVREAESIMSPGSSSASVASLLSQLKPLSVGAVGRSVSAPVLRGTSTSYGSRSLEVNDDRRNLSFRAALPILSELSQDDSLVAAIKKMKEEQDTLERTLWAEREAMYAKYHDKFKVAQKKAQMIGTPVTQNEIEMLTDAFEKEIQKFDHDRVIPAWDSIVTRQQQELERFEVPAMFVTSVPQDRERQQQVIQVLQTVVGSKPA